MDPISLVQAVGPKIGDIGAVYYFDPATLARGKELGLDGFRFYFLGRGGTMGNVAAPMVTGAFGYFNDALVTKMWNSGVERIPATEAAAAYNECNYEIGRQRLADVAGLDAFNDAAAKVVAAAHPAGLTLFSGYLAQPVPEDAPAKAMHMAVLLRELRGSMHLLAVMAKGLTPALAHAIKRPDAQELFGQSPELPPISDADRAAMAAAEDLTNELLAPMFAVLTADEGAALVAGTEAIHAAVTAD